MPAGLDYKRSFTRAESCWGSRQVIDEDVAAA